MLLITERNVRTHKERWLIVLCGLLYEIQTNQNDFELGFSIRRRPSNHRNT